MKEMRMDMTFEERLMAGKKPLVESEESEEEEDGEPEETDKAEDAAEPADKENESLDDIIREAEKNISG